MNFTKTLFAVAMASTMVACGGGGGGSSASTGGSTVTPADPKDTAAWSEWELVSEERDGAEIVKTYERECIVTVNGNRDSIAPTCSGESTKEEREDAPRDGLILVNNISQTYLDQECGVYSHIYTCDAMDPFNFHNTIDEYALERGGVLVADPSDFSHGTHGEKVNRIFMQGVVGYVDDTTRVSGHIGFHYDASRGGNFYGAYKFGEDGREHRGHSTVSAVAVAAEEGYQMMVLSSDSNWDQTRNPQDFNEQRVLYAAIDALEFAAERELVIVESTENGPADTPCQMEGNFDRCGELSRADDLMDIPVTMFTIGAITSYNEKWGELPHDGEILYIDGSHPDGHNGAATSWATPRAAAIIYRYMQDNDVAYDELYDAFVRDCTVDRVITCQ